MLVGEQGVDPTSQLYYTAIESHVAAAFPDKWAHWQQLTSGETYYFVLVKCSCAASAA
jgi:hypothetical protein